MSPWILFSIVLIAWNIDYSFGRPRSSENTDNYCYAETENPYLYFSSKTAYSTVYYRNNIHTIPSECKPRQLWMLIRHGARFPLRRKMEAFRDLTKLKTRIIHNHEHHHRGELCEEDLGNLKDWTIGNLPLEESDKLTKQGYDDLFDIGERTWNRFNDLFKSPYSQKIYKVQYTNHEKTKHSAEAFTNGLFDQKVEVPEAKPEDLLSRIYSKCKVLPIPGADDPPDAGKGEKSSFKNGPVVAEMVQNISRRLGFEDNLSMDEIDNMYDMCRYKKAWSIDDLSPWCACFLESDLKILEYIGDLAYYYNSGPGYSANLRTGCPLVQDMIHRFRDIATNRYSNQPNALFYFGHSTTLYNLVARLGLAKDDVRLTHENYYNMTNRKFRTSLIGPFSANFAAVLLNCESGIKNRVVFYLNEMPFKFNECHGYVCSWDTLEKMYGNITDPSTCNFNFCEKDQPYTSEEEMTTVAAVETEKFRSYVEENVQKENEVDNGAFEEITGNHETPDGYEKNKVLHRKTTKLTDNQEENRVSVGKEKKIMMNRLYMRNLEVQEQNSGTYKPKTNWSERDMHVSWLLISIVVCIVVLVLCNSYTSSKSKMTKNGYEKMSSTLPLSDFQH